MPGIVSMERSPATAGAPATEAAPDGGAGHHAGLACLPCTAMLYGVLTGSGLSEQIATLLGRWPHAIAAFECCARHFHPRARDRMVGARNRQQQRRPRT